MIRKTRWVAVLGLAAVLGLGCGETTEVTDTATTPTDTATTPADTATTPDDSVDATPAPETGEPAVDATPAPGEGTPEGDEGGTAAAEVTLSEEDIALIQKLPAEDQALALAQKVCPATGEALGSMGVPIKVTAGEKAIFVCCKGCVEEVENDPDAALAKLGQE